MPKKKAHLKRPAARQRKAVSRRRPSRKPAAIVGVLTSAQSFLAVPELKPSEGYAGILLDKSGKPTAHLIEIAVRGQDGTHEEQTAWAKSVGGELPDLQEGALLYANRKHAHESRYYWTRELHAGNADYAWVQTFGNGGQDNVHKGNRYLACAVRRAPI